MEADGAVYRKPISNWKKFKLLIWKDWRIMWANKLSLIFEIVTPVIFSALLLFLRGMSSPTDLDKPFLYPALPVTTTNPNLLPNTTWTLAYTGTDPSISAQIMADVRTSMNITDSMLYFNNPLDMYTYLDTVEVRPLAGISFQDMIPNDTKAPRTFRIMLTFPAELRIQPSFGEVLNWQTDLLYPIFRQSGPRNMMSFDGGAPPGYYQEQFIALQNALSLAFIRLQRGNNFTDELPTLFIQRFPNPTGRIDKLVEALKMIVPLVFFLSFMYPCITIVKMITMEKETQLKESMKIMGLQNHLHWIAWLGNCMLFMTFTIVIILLLLAVKWQNNVAVFTFSGIIPLWLFLTAYSLSVVTFCFMLSVLFSHANTAATVTGFVWFLFIVPFFMTQSNYKLLDLSTKLVISLFHNTAVSYGFLLILTHEAEQEGLQWDNYFVPVSIDDDFSVGAVTIMMLVSSVLQMTIAYYIEQVAPGEFGVPRHWYFPVEGVVQMGRRCLKYKETVDSAPKFVQNQQHIEKVLETKQPGIKIDQLRKVFAGDRVAVHGLTLSMYPDEIAVFLGENGAGKTTTMSMLTGMLLPTSGTATINGCDIRTEIDCVRHSIGFCPQHNILFDELTVREHILFFSSLKGLSQKEADIEVEKYVDLLELKDKLNAQSHTLPGGMKRRLSIGVALCGGSRVVMCDEPTSGMDPSARRALWDLLQKEKKGRTIMLSTQFMDEADVLGDRVAIMKSGELMCYGSAIFLKRAFASGYRLTIEKGPTCDVNRITQLMRGYIPNVNVDRNVGAELTYRLETVNAAPFQPMLKSLEDQTDQLGISSYGISQTNLEDVFMQVTVKKNEGEPEPLAIETKGVQLKIALLSGRQLVYSQLCGMVYKKFIFTTRNWILILVQNIIPIVLTSITVEIARSVSITKFIPALTIALDEYQNNPIVLMSYDIKENDTLSHGFIRKYMSFFEDPKMPRSLRTVQNVTDFVLSLSHQEHVTFLDRNIVGVSVETGMITAWFNNEAFHSIPLAINMVHNALLKRYCDECEIVVVNAPLKFTAQTQLDMQNSVRDFGFQLASNVGFAMSFVSAFYILFYIKERVSRAKLLQFVGGANVWTYWITSWSFDVICFLTTTILLSLTLYCYGEEGWASITDQTRMFVLFIFFIWSILPFIYISAFTSDVSSSGLIQTIMIGVFLGNAFFYITYVLEFPDLELTDVSNAMVWVLMIVPHFAIIHGLKNLDKMNTYIPICAEACKLIPDCVDPEDVCKSNLPYARYCCILNYFDWETPGIGRNLFYLGLTGIVQYVFLFLIEFGIFERVLYGSVIYKQWLKSKPAIREHPALESPDADVEKENHRIARMGYTQIKAYNLVLRNMVKQYDNFVAVDHLSIAVEAGECFGLLGVNGAGKTTTFKMLIGDLTIDDGEAWVRGFSLKNEMRKVYQNIGYCPQYDALLDELTGRETLRLYCLLRGIPRQDIERLTFKLAKELDFMKHIDKLSKQYSGGNKRKLSTAIALVGQPAVIYLDEPTTGMDPGAKRKLWNLLSKYRSAGNTIVLTSHSMEECEALCTRLAIMVNGEFKCLGSTQRLKNLFSRGYLLVILMSSNVRYGLTSNAIDVMMNARAFVEHNFDGAELKENYQGRLTFHIPMSEMKWSAMFGIMEAYKDSLQIENYSLSQTTLEQVFLAFTKYQKDTSM